MAQHTIQPQFLLLSLFIISAAQAASQPRPRCPTNCGSLSIPYPFGTTEGCYLDPSFLITCHRNSSTTTPILGVTNVTVLDISLNGELRILASVSHDCYNKTGNLVSSGYPWFNLSASHFYISSNRNKVTAIGCDTVGIIWGSDYQGKNYTTGCVSLCDKLDEKVADGSCYGTGCCQASIPQGLSGSLPISMSVNNHTRVNDFNPCGYTFLSEEGAYKFSSTDLRSFQKTTFPVVLDWAVANKTCHEAQKNLTSYACRADHSECVEANFGVGYRCKCSSGFRGNPFLVDGCQDINECVELNPCNGNGTCHNFAGGFKCACLEGYEGDVMRNNGTGCLLKVGSGSGMNKPLVIALSVAVSALVLLLGSFYVYWGVKKRKLIKLREIFFQQNGGLLLQQQIAKRRGSAETAKIFTAEELKKATNNFDERRVLGQGGHGTVYKGVLANNTVVAIKKSKICDQSQIEQFINEVIVLSQVNHRNVVKILGCCLETEVPLLVYEFITDGTLYKHLHGQSQSSKLSWRMRLRIASETAGALSYLHSATSTPIIHRDVKTTNILLDCNLTAKVADFGASRLVPLDQTQLTTLVQGTLGYLDPEYFQTSQLTDKSDVYSFGVVLAELLTSKKALSFDRPESDRNLSMYFVSSIKEGTLLQIVDKSIINETNVRQIMEFANLANRCLRIKGEDRPTMKEVAMELEGLRIIEKHPWGGGNVSSEETEHLLSIELSPAYIDGIEYGVGGNAPTAMMESINQMSTSLDGGR